MGISLGVVGLGAFGRAFADLFMSHPLVDRVALCARDPERLKEYAGKESWKSKLRAQDLYTSFDDICRSEVDALAIMTQYWQHAPQCIQAMEAGKHVYSAVPVMCVPAGDEILAWCDRLVETVKRTGQHYMLGETTYYRPQAMYCRRRAAEGAFGAFVSADGEYLHDVDAPVSLREVGKMRSASRAGREWLRLEETYRARGARNGPMLYPTHSTGGPMCVMDAHAVKVCAFGMADRSGDPFFQGDAFSNESALFTMSNGATMRIREYRQIGYPERETFRVYGTQGSFENDRWLDNAGESPVAEAEMRDALPIEVEDAFRSCRPDSPMYGGHGGSHPYLVHEFVDAIASGRRPAISIWEAVRYTAAGVTAHLSALRDGEVLSVPDWGDAPR